MANNITVFVVFKDYHSRDEFVEAVSDSVITTSQWSGDSRINCMFKCSHSFYKEIAEALIEKHGGTSESLPIFVLE